MNTPSPFSAYLTWAQSAHTAITTLQKMTEQQTAAWVAELLRLAPREAQHFLRNFAFGVDTLERIVKYGRSAGSCYPSAWNPRRADGLDRATDADLLYLRKLMARVQKAWGNSLRIKIKRNDDARLEYEFSLPKKKE